MIPLNVSIGVSIWLRDISTSIVESYSVLTPEEFTNMLTQITEIVGKNQIKIAEAKVCKCPTCQKKFKQFKEQDEFVNNETKLH